jgi:hypothetical protein
VSESPIFQLERLYFGHLVIGGQRTSATPGVVARTPGVTPAQVAECLRLAPLAPPSLDQVTDDMPGALALFRGETTDFILVKAQNNDAGHPQVLYILAPVAPLRALGGNLRALRSLALMDMPSFSAVKTNLLPFELRDLTPSSAEEQADTLLNLLLYCHDSFKTVEGILAALIQGWPLAIVNSPPSVDQRLRFLQGLLNLLPVPARVGITFATHVNEPASSPVQVKFMSQHAVPAQHLVFDWENGKLLTDPPEHSYSHYMIAQLRLDPPLVVEQTEQLSRTAVWRAMHKENLGRALAWISRRAAIDQTVRDGQPADRDIVAAILREDPTLPDDLRLLYVRHLLAFALALNEPESADVVPTLCVTNPDITQAVADQLHAAIDGGQAQTAFKLLEHWLLRVPEASAIQWHPILYSAAKQHLKVLLDQHKPEEAVELIDSLQHAPSALRLDEAMPDLVRLAVQTVQPHPRLAQMLFLTAVRALPAGELHRLMIDAQFTSQLPAETQAALAYLQPQPRHPVSPRALDQGARVFGDGHRMRVLARFVECAAFLHRPELIDTAALQALLVMTQSSEVESYQALVQQLADDLSEVSVIQTLEPPGARVLVQLLLQIHDFSGAVGLLEFCQNAVFGPEHLEEYTHLVGELFRMVALPPEALNEALMHLEGSQIRPEPRAMIFCSVLINRQWADDQDYAARRLTTMIFNDNSLIDVIGRENMLKLLDFYARPRKALDALRVAAALVDRTVNMGAEGAVLITRMWPSITWDAEVSQAAVELVRRFVRGVALREAPTLITYFSNQLGAHIGEAIRATYLMREVIAESDLAQFVEAVTVAAQLFIDLATVYHTDKDLPPPHRLRRDLDQMTGNLSEQERQRVAQNILEMTRFVVELGHSRTQKRGTPSAEELLIQGKMTPQNGIDLLRFIGGHFADRQAVPLAMEREEMAHIFGTRSAAMFLRETNIITHLLSGLQTAFAKKDASQVTPQALAAELDSLWNTLSLYNQRLLRDQFAQSCQQLAEVISIMSDRGRDRILSDTSIGRQLETGQRQPHTAVETLRWIHGYFAHKHGRT